ncbi:DUF86 domain-containing protein [Cytobacillus purgationiresistens]|uniref:Uncharacterized protein YutE (UPF0331/DUF86 family) n=1 Tax=Cytobacillus purgationiresistens TaxID=863449 RepID=A0ABU0APV7_9BACI|nr:DUF86 domain-containing protein [Cytobacillus purgationiresistens]MDQ0273060.1 uncharacterized protein YutE (UPF0331/DUF86 family) [Cytobacillus purgationiresistens]
MYFVDREKIEETLVYLEKQLNLFEQQETFESPLEKMALERMAQMMIESILDVGNAMIDGFIMRDPGSYEDIIDILDDEKVIDQEMSISFKGIIDYRKTLVQAYTGINHEHLNQVFKEHLPMLLKFPANVRDYLTKELGPVSAFRK